MSNYDPTDKTIPLKERLTDWAQNNEMIDGHYTAPGKLMMEAAKTLNPRAMLAFDDDNALRLALNGSNYFSALWVLSEKLRLYTKHTPADEQSVGDVMAIFYNCTANINWDEIE